MKKGSRLFFLILGGAACFSIVSGFARAQQAEFVAINQQVGVSLGRIPISQGRIDEVENPVPLKKLVLRADKYRIIISGSAGSSLHLYFDLVPLPAGKG